ncbi:MAG: alpha/beta hydrolase [Marmoricola sp.]
MRRILIAATAGALAVGLANVSAGAATPAVAAGEVSAHAGATAARTATASRSRVHWRACDDPRYASRGIQCASIPVPLDYAHPHGRMIHLEISRKKHDPSAGAYQGAIVLNPGGPGGSGLVLPVLQDYVPGKAALRYDWIGFDPRGVGASRPALHCNPHYVTADRPFYVPTTHRIERYWRRHARSYAHDCGTSKARRLLGHMTTRDNARDVDSIRRALGQKKIGFYGFSWGTYLGTTWATLFPHTVKRLILDGVVNPHRVWYGANLDQDRAFDRNMDVYWRYLAAHDSAFGLGTDAKAIRAGFYAERRHLVRHPAADGRLGPDELTDAMLSAGYYVYDWVTIGDAYAALINHGDGGPLFGMFKDGNLGRDAENGYAVYNAVQCTDAHWPGWPQTRRDSWRVHQDAPFETWGNTWYNAPCVTWPARSRHQFTIRGARVHIPVLMINETKDAATPYSGALAMRRIFPTSVLLAGVGGTTHAGSLSGVSCVDDRIARYLASGKVPARKRGNRADVRCRPVPAPQPDAASARLVAPDGARAALMRAQLPSLH